MKSEEQSAAFAGSIDLAAEALGGETLLCSDAFFAPMENLLKSGRGVFLPDKYTDRGKWMDGWEPRRRRAPGHDWCIIRLGTPGTIIGFDIDTNHFTGNHPPFASVDACFAPDAGAESLRDEVQWTRVLDQAPLKRGSQNLFSAEGRQVWTHVRLNIYPAGGVARFRVYGVPHVREDSEEMDLAGLANGGMALACSDMFFSPMNNLLLPERAAHMGEGWETRRSRPPGMDWIIIKLASLGEVDRILVDTHHFKGNFPDRCAIDGIHWPDAPAHALTRLEEWTEIVSETPLGASREHILPVNNHGPWTHLRLRIYPDGGVSRLRALGKAVTATPGEDSLLNRLNGMSESEAKEVLTRCCGSSRWVEAMSAARPFVSRTHLFGESENLWWHLGDGDWLEAFDHHPEIGADISALKQKFAATANWSANEQQSVSEASEEVLSSLVHANRRYREQFGFLFIVCATGKSAGEMLELLEHRLAHEPPWELRVAAGEQMKITRLRLEKLEGES